MLDAPTLGFQERQPSDSRLVASLTAAAIAAAQAVWPQPQHSRSRSRSHNLRLRLAFSPTLWPPRTNGASPGLLHACLPVGGQACDSLGAGERFLQRWVHALPVRCWAQPNETSIWGTGVGVERNHRILSSAASQLSRNWSGVAAELLDRRPAGWTRAEAYRRVPMSWGGWGGSWELRLGEVMGDMGFSPIRARKITENHG